VTKLAEARARWSGRLEDRLFSARERSGLKRSGLKWSGLGAEDAGIAVAFGIKESVIKLLGGLPPGSRFHDIEVERTEEGWRVGLHAGLASAEAAAGRTLVTGSLAPAGLPPLVWAAALESDGTSR
jgi:phosphopantetheinyl transferase (holo-ACP synthase)